MANDDVIRLKISEITPLRNPFVVYLYTNFFARNNDSTLKFFYSYQVIELLIGERFKTLLRNLKKDLLFSDDNANIVSVRKTLRKFSDSVNEETRLKKLISELSIDEDEKLQIKQCFSSFLRKFGAMDIDDIAEELYQIRNLLFHNYERVRQITDETDLNEVANASFRLSTLLLINYRVDEIQERDISFEIDTPHWLANYTVLR